jgi:hypothetical protein
MLGVLLPRLLNIIATEKVLDESTSIEDVSNSKSHAARRQTYCAKGSVYVEWK